MIVYRHFRNPDVPRIVSLWNESRLGRGAAVDFSLDAYDMLVLAQPYFDRHGLILACDNGQIVGFSHAGFGPDAKGGSVAKDRGVVCAVVVRPEFRRRGIGTELVSRAEQYLLSAGAKEIVAGESLESNPFYLGLYGGADSAGFLDSDPQAAGFFNRLGYVASDRYCLLSRQLQTGKPPFEPRTVALKRELKFGILDRPPGATWWWFLRHGRFESLTFTLVPNSGGSIPALVTCWGMELHGGMRNERIVGITDLFVAEKSRRKGYAKVLLCDVLRRLRDDGVTTVEVVVPAGNAAALSLFHWLGFVQIDAGTVYRRAELPEKRSLANDRSAVTSPECAPSGGNRADGNRADGNRADGNRADGNGAEEYESRGKQPGDLLPDSQTTVEWTESELTGRESTG